MCMRSVSLYSFSAKYCSHHLKLLVDSELFGMTQKSKPVYYSLTISVKSCSNVVKSPLEVWICSNCHSEE
jgi:hypothetical protein